MEQEIVAMLPSQALKNKIAQTGHRFSEADLLRILYGYAPTFDERIRLLNRFAKNASPSVAGAAATLAEWQVSGFRNFRENTKGFVFELSIQDTPDCPAERYLCDSYESALDFIDLYHKEYEEFDAEDGADSRYEIVKRKVFSRSAGSGFSEDAVSRCILGQGKTLLKFDDWERSPTGVCDGICIDCDKICPTKCNEVLYPCFTKDCDLIEYTERGKKRLGVCRHDPGEPERLESLYVIPMESDAVRFRKFERDFDSHVHVDLPEAETVSIQRLSDEERENYRAYVEYVKSQAE